MPSRGTHVSVVLSDKDVPGEWGAKIKNQSTNQLTIGITTPSDCLITKWKFRVDIIRKDNDGNTTVVKSKRKEAVYTVCNPWNKGKGGGEVVYFPKICICKFHFHIKMQKMVSILLKAGLLQKIGRFDPFTG